MASSLFALVLVHGAKQEAMSLRNKKAAQSGNGDAQKPPSKLSQQTWYQNLMYW